MLRKILSALFIVIALFGLQIQAVIAQDSAQLTALMAIERKATDQLNSFQISISNTTLNTEQRKLNSEESMKQLTATRLELVKYANAQGTTAEAYAMHEKILTDLNDRYRSLVESSTEKGYDTTGYVLPPSAPSFQTAKESVELENTQRLADRAREASDAHEESLKGNITAGCGEVCEPKKSIFNKLNVISQLIYGLCCLLAAFVEQMSSLAASIANTLQSYIETLSASLSAVIGQGVNLQLWQYFRSFLNYALVAVLIIAAFANVLRINLDTYAVKKILPSLILGFILANLSLYICRMILDIAQVLANTADTIFKPATGGLTISAILGTKFVPLVVGLMAASGAAGGILAPFTAGASTAAGIIIALLVGIFILFLPVVTLIALYLIFNIQYYVIIFLVIISPLAFLCIGIPSLRKYFDMWWKAFTTWAFMKPIAYFLLGFAGFVLVQGKELTNDFIAFVIALLLMWFAVIIPFRAGGVINATIARYGRRGLGVGGYAAGGASNQAGRLSSYLGSGLANSSIAQGTGIGAQLARGVAGSLKLGGSTLKGVQKLPATVKEQYEAKKKKSEAEQSASAYTAFGDNRRLEALQDAESAEEEKKISDNEDHIQLADRLLNAKTQAERVAIMRKVYKNKMNHKFLKELKNNTKYASIVQKYGLGTVQDNAEGRAKARENIMGGDAWAKRQSREMQSMAKSNGYVHEANALKSDGAIKAQVEIDRDASGSMGGDARTFARTANPDDWVAKDGGGFSNAWIQQANEGSVVSEMISDTQALSGISSFAVDGLRDTTKLASIVAAKTAADTTGATAQSVLAEADRVANAQLAAAQAMPPGLTQTDALARATAAINAVNFTRANTQPGASPAQVMAALTRAAREERRVQLDHQLRNNATSLNPTQRTDLLNRVFR